MVSDVTLSVEASVSRVSFAVKLLLALSPTFTRLVKSFRVLANIFWLIPIPLSYTQAFTENV